MQQVEVEIPKDHPGLPRLMEAAKRLPDVELVDQAGVRIRKRQLELPDAVNEFFQALAAVVGEEYAVELREHLGVRNRLRELEIPKMMHGLLQNPMVTALMSGLGR